MKTSIDAILVAFVVAVAVALAAGMFAGYYMHPDLLWRGFYHDRNSHYSFGLDLALAVRTFDPVWFFTELEKAVVWPPLHGLVLAVVLAILRPDYRLGVVPSLCGWVMTVVFVWIIVRRLFAARDEGLFAASVAVILTAASPAFRLISTDVMLEGLGAGLSAISLWAYLRAASEPSRIGHWRLLGFSLTALFFEKGNYWGLVASSLAIAAVSENFAVIIGRMRSLVQAMDRSTFARKAIRNPLLIAFVVVVALVVYIYGPGPRSVRVLGFNVTLYPPRNLITLAYALLFARVTIAWLRHRAAFETWLGLPGRTLYYWHIAPILVSFLFPRRLSAFIWFIGPANTGGATTFDPLHGITIYSRAFGQGFHLAAWMAVLSVALALIGALRIRSFPPGARAIFLLAVIGCAGVVIHPQHQGRFLTSWVFSVWLCAGAGAGVLLSWINAKRWAILRPLIAVLVVLLLAASQLFYKPSPAAYETAIHPTSGPLDLDLVRPYFADLENAREVLVATTFGMSRLFAWTIREHRQCKLIVDDPWIDSLPTREDIRRIMAARVAETTADHIVVIDAPHARYALPVLGWIYDRMVGIVDAMRTQDRFVRIATYPIQDHGAMASVWRRRDAL